MGKKMLTFILCVCFIIPSMLVLGACSLFGNAAFVNEVEWQNALKYNEKVVITQTEGDVVKGKIYLDGSKVKTETLSSGVTITTYYNFDGTKYYKYVSNSGVWAKAEISKEEYNKESGNLSETLKYNNFSYSESKGSFEAKSITVNNVQYSSIIILFTSKKLDTIRMFVKDDETTIKYDYKQTFTVDLPLEEQESNSGNGGNSGGSSTGGDNNTSGGNDSSSGGNQTTSNQVTQDEWNLALNYDDKVYLEYNAIFSISKYYQDTNKIKIVIEAFGGTETVYYSKEGTTYWQYYVLNGAYVKEQIDEEDYNLARIKNLINEYNYTDFNYNQAEDVYVKEEETNTDKLQFRNKKLTNIVSEGEALGSEYIITKTLNYDADVSFELPQAQVYVRPEGSVTEEQWDKALEFTGTVYGRKTVDGQLESELYQKEDGNLKTNDMGSWVYFETDGTNYWRYTEGDSVTPWVKEESDYYNWYIYCFRNFTELIFEYDYNDYEFNEVQKCYEYSDNEQEIAVKFEGENIASITIFEFEYQTETVITFDYAGNFTIAFPQV